MSKIATIAKLGVAGAFMLALAPAQAADPIKVGVVTPLSGTYAPIGKQVRWGAELAVKEINAAGGVNGRPFESCSRMRKPIRRSQCAKPRSCCNRTRSIF